LNGLPNPPPEPTAEKRGRPDIVDPMKVGEFRSVRAAAIEAPASLFLSDNHLRQSARSWMGQSAGVRQCVNEGGGFKE
jgi:hypothetical protein